MKPEDPVLHVSTVMDEELMLKRSFWAARELRQLMSKKTDVTYDQNFRGALDAYLDKIEAKMINMGIRLMQ